MMHLEGVARVAVVAEWAANRRKRWFVGRLRCRYYSRRSASFRKLSRGSMRLAERASLWVAARALPGPADLVVVRVTMAAGSILRRCGPRNRRQWKRPRKRRSWSAKA